MNVNLLIASALLVGIAVAHSVLGERYLLTRLFRRENLPRLFGSDWFTKRTLRFAWHLTSVAYFGFAGLLAVLARDTPGTTGTLLRVIAGTFILTGSVAAVASRGKHLSWVVFLAVGVFTWLGI